MHVSIIRGKCWLCWLLIRLSAVGCRMWGMWDRFFFFEKLILDKGDAHFHWKTHLRVWVKHSSSFHSTLFSPLLALPSSIPIILLLRSILFYCFTFPFFFTLIHFSAIVFFMHDLHHHMFTFTLKSLRMDLILNLAIHHIIYNPNTVNHSTVFKR